MKLDEILDGPLDASNGTEMPKMQDAYEFLAAVYLKQGNNAAAIERYRALAARTPDSPGPATVVGMLLEASGDRGGARAQYQSVLAKQPNAAVAANNLAWILTEEGQHDEAMRLAQIAVEGLRKRPEPLDTLGTIHLRRNQPVDAVAAFSKAVAMAPDRALYRQHLEQARAAANGKAGG